MLLGSLGRLVVVEGNIGAGKSTCLETLAAAAPSTVAIFPEPVESWRNYHGYNLLQQMYEGGLGAAFQFQSCVFVTCLDVNEQPTECALRVHERSVFSAFHCFASVMAKSGALSPSESAVLAGQFHHVERSHPSVHAIVYLRTTPAVALARVRQRGRVEEGGVDESYLTALHEAHDRWLLGTVVSRPAPVIVVDANVDKEELRRVCVSLLPTLLSTG